MGFLETVEFTNYGSEKQATSWISLQQCSAAVSEILNGARSSTCKISTLGK